ncbi:MAG: hypothetical protein QHH00_01870 [Methanomassiliicoccales archaeon]|nr:hypothetical protein [Methanomassiliicoccales archaeon]
MISFRISILRVHHDVSVIGMLENVRVEFLCQLYWSVKIDEY